MNFMVFNFGFQKKSVNLEKINEDKKNQTNTVIRNALQIFYKYLNQE